MSNRDRLIKEVYDEAKNCFNKGIIVTREVLLEAISESIGDAVIGDHETLISGKVEVSEEVTVQGDSMICRKVKVTFYSRQFRVSSSNWLVPVSDFYKTGKEFSGPVHPYTGPLESQPELEILHGNKKDYDRENIIFGYSSYRMRIVSVEKQDVFVVTKFYSPGKSVERSVQTPDNHYTGSYNRPIHFYESTADRVPKTLEEHTYWYYPAQKKSSWFGLRTTKDKIPGSDPIVGRTYIRNQKRDNFKYSINFFISDSVSEFIEASSVAFDPLRLEQLAAC
ncbi:hypothetical protein [Stenotrophomonas phage RAS14]